MLCKTICLIDGRRDVTLTAYILEDSPEMLDGKPRGAVLVCPGGAYLGCSDREGEPVAMAFAAMGYHAFVLRYSVYSAGEAITDFSKPLPAKPDCVFPNPVRDIGLAMLHIRENAGAWRLDVDKIALCGFSAGAHNCAMYSVYWDKPLLTGLLGATAGKLRPAACILGYTLSDYIYMFDKPRNANSANPYAKAIFSAACIALMGTEHPDEGLLARVSPARLVDAATPPMYLWSTSEDNQVPVQHTLLLALALADKGIPFEAHVFENGPHGLSLATQASAGAKSEINPSVAQWVGLCAAWLEKRFEFDLPKLNVWQRRHNEEYPLRYKPEHGLDLY